MEDVKYDEKLQAVQLISKVSGIGPSAGIIDILLYILNLSIFLAHELVYHKGVRTIEDLKKIELTHHQKIGIKNFLYFISFLIGLKYFYEFEKRIPREEMQKLDVFKHK